MEIDRTLPATSQLYSAMEGPETRCPHRTDPLSDLLYLEKTGNVHDYFDSFKLLLARVEISEDLAIEVFLRGLEPEIQISVRSFNPNDLYVAYSLARLKESTIRVLGVKEDIVVDEFGEENGLEAAKEGSENDVFEVFEEMPKLNDVEGLPSEHEGYYRDQIYACDVSFPHTIKSGCFQGPMDQPSRINHDYKISAMAGTRRPRVKPHLYPSRYISAERYSEALDILQSGACIQLTHEQVTCGAELAVLFVEALVKGKYPCDDETIDRVRKIYKKFPQISVPQQLGDDEDDMQKLSEAIGAAKIRVDGCSSFLRAALRWSSQFGSHKTGAPEIHAMLAEYIFSESPEVDMAKVSFHFVRGNNPKKFASTLVNFMGKCYPGEDDLAIARAALMYCAMGNLRDANNLQDEIKKQVQAKNLELPGSDLMQFIEYLLQVLQRDALPLFNMLRANYRSSIERDPSFNEFIDLIAEKFYGVQRRNPLQGMFGDIFKMMGGE